MNGDPSENNYTRFVKKIRKVKNGESVDAFVYIAVCEKFLSEGLRPKSDYIYKMLFGKNYISGSYYEKLCSVPVYESVQNLRILNDIKSDILSCQFEDYDIDYWKGADVIVTSSGSGEGIPEHITFLSTSHASPVIWLICRLRDRFIGIDYMNKYFFYAEIVNRAKAVLSAEPDIDSKSLLLKILESAYVMSYQINGI